MIDVLQTFSSPVREWFAETFGEPTPRQVQGWPAILAARSLQSATAVAYAPDPPAKTQVLAKHFYSLLRIGGFSHPV